MEKKCNRYGSNIQFICKKHRGFGLGEIQLDCALQIHIIILILCFDNYIYFYRVLYIFIYILYCSIIIIVNKYYL